MITSKDLANQIPFKGLAISPGLAHGTAYIHRDIIESVQLRYSVSPNSLNKEWMRIKAAIDTVDQNLERSALRVQRELGHDVGAIFEAHRMLLHDSALIHEFKQQLNERRVNAEEIVKSVLSQFELRIRAMESGVMSERGDDIADLARRLLRKLTGSGHHTITKCPKACVLVARHLLPSECVHLKGLGVAAVVTERGGATSHAALLTREMGVPAVSCIPGVSDRIATGEELLVDGNTGLVTIRPDEEARTRFLNDLSVQNEVCKLHRSRCQELAKTEDGEVIQVMANVGCQSDIDQALEYGADGIGLYRIEHHFLTRATLPSEDELYTELRGSLLRAAGKSITIRLLDTGGDKGMPWLDLPHEPDPFLGRRGIRFLLAWPELLRMQFRVLLRLSREFRLGVLIPMVTTLDEVIQVRAEMDRVAKDLNLPSPRLGAMIETPAAALCTSKIAEVAQFLSIGSNDLTQYTMVAGRENPLVASYLNDESEAVLRLIQIVCAEAKGLAVSVCGELAASKHIIHQLLNFGIRTLSVAPPLIPEVKEQIRQVTLKPSWQQYC